LTITRAPILTATTPRQSHVALAPWTRTRVPIWTAGRRMLRAALCTPRGLTCCVLNAAAVRIRPIPSDVPHGTPSSASAGWAQQRRVGATRHRAVAWRSEGAATSTRARTNACSLRAGGRIVCMCARVRGCTAVEHEQRVAQLGVGREDCRVVPRPPSPDRRVQPVHLESACARSQRCRQGNATHRRAGEPVLAQMWAAASPVPAQMWAGVSPVPAQMWAGVSPVPAQMWAGASPVPAQMWAGASPVPEQMWAGASPVPAQMWAGASPVPAQMWAAASPVPAQMWAGASPVPAQMWAGAHSGSAI
jgi:hypothetical protein